MIASTVRSLFGRGRKPTLNLASQTGTILFLHGKGDFAFEVSRVARHQAEIQGIVGSRHEPRQRLEALAWLTVESDAISERPVVAVVIDGRVVGYMPGYLATQFREWQDCWSLSGFRAQCRCTIIGFKGESGTMRHTVKLDIEMPFKMTLS